MKSINILLWVAAQITKKAYASEHVYDDLMLKRRRVGIIENFEMSHQELQEEHFDHFDEHEEDELEYTDHYADPFSHECSCQPFIDHASGEHGAKIAYLIIAHNERTLEDSRYAFNALAAPGNIILIHIDSKLDWEYYMHSSLRWHVEHCRCGADVLVDSVHSCEWAKWSMNLPTLWAMDLLTTHPRFKNRWDTFMNLSGDSMPTLTPKRLSTLFANELADKNFVTSLSCETGLVPTEKNLFPEGWDKRVPYEEDFVLDYTEFIDDAPKAAGTHPYYQRNRRTRRKVDRTITLTTYFGSQWITLTYDFVEYLSRELRRPDSLPSRYRDALIETDRIMTDETFFATLLMQVPQFAHTIPEMNEDGSLVDYPSLMAFRYERMDEHKISAFGWYPTEQRYLTGEHYIGGVPKIWGPYFLGVYDFANIKRSGALFVRKVSVYVDPNIIHMLPVDDLELLPSIEWANIHLSEVPDWESSEFQKKMENLAYEEWKSNFSKEELTHPDDREDNSEESHDKEEDENSNAHHDESVTFFEDDVHHDEPWH